MMKTGVKTRAQIITLCEGAVCVAMALILSYIKIDLGALGGSIGFAMVPIIVFAVFRGGLLWGVGAGLVFGTLKFFMGGGSAISWTSMLLDYSLAYAAVGLAGCFKCKLGAYGYGIAAFIGCFARFITHFISGITIYAIYAEMEYMGFSTPAPWIYSVIYNGIYMLPSTIITVAACLLIGFAMMKVPRNTI